MVRRSQEDPAMDNTSGRHRRCKCESCYVRNSGNSVVFVEAEATANARAMAGALALALNARGNNVGAANDTDDDDDPGDDW